MRLNKSYTTTTTTTTYHQSASCYYEAKNTIDPELTISRDISVSAKRDLAKKKSELKNNVKNDNLENNNNLAESSRLFMLAGKQENDEIITIKEPEKIDESCNFNFGGKSGGGGVVNYGTDFDFGLDEIDKQLTSFRSNTLFEEEDDVKPVTLKDVDINKNMEMQEFPKNNNSNQVQQRYSSSSFDSVPLPPPEPMENNGMNNRIKSISEESISNSDEDFDSETSSNTSSESIDGAILSLQQRIKKFNEK